MGREGQAGVNKVVSKSDIFDPTARNASGEAALAEIERLFVALGRSDLPPRTKKLYSGSMVKKAKKLVEEATEMSFEAMFGHRRGVIEESADMIYHMVILWHACGVTPDEVWKEMHRRAQDLGVAEKLPKRVAVKSGKSG